MSTDSSSDSSSDYNLIELVQRIERNSDRLTSPVSSPMPSPLSRATLQNIENINLALANRYNRQLELMRLRRAELENIPLPDMESIPVVISPAATSTICSTYFQFSIWRWMNGDRSWADHTVDEYPIMLNDDNVLQTDTATAIISNNNRPTEAAQTSANIPTNNLVDQQIPTIDLTSSDDESRPATPTPQNQDTPVTRPISPVVVEESPPLRCRLRPRVPKSYAPYKRNTRASKPK